MKSRCDLLILDADDTLWESALFFERAEHDFLELMLALGFGRDETRCVVRRRDVERLSLTGYGARPYADTLRSIMLDKVQPPQEWAVTAMGDIETALLGHPVILLPGVMETLELVHRLGIPTVIYTMGEYNHQHDKFIRSGLSSLCGDLRVVDEKNTENLEELVNDFCVNPSQCLLVGNSPRTDINPALELGIRAVHLARDRTWAAEREDFIDPGAVVTIESMSNLQDLILKDIRPFAAERGT